METWAFDVAMSTFDAECEMPVEAVLGPLEANVVTTSGESTMEMGSSAQAMITCLGSSPDTQIVETELAFYLILSA